MDFSWLTNLWKKPQPAPQPQYYWNDSNSFSNYSPGFGANTTNPSAFPDSRATNPAPGVLGAFTTGGGGGNNRIPNPGPTPGPTGPSEQDLARSAYEGRLRAVQGIFDRTRDEANSLREQAAKRFQDLLSSVNAFRDRSRDQFANAGQEITNEASKILGSNARTAQEALGTSRALGRSMGLGASSRFNQQNKVVSNLAGTQGNTLAARGEQNRSNRNLYDTRLDQAQAQEREAESYRDAINAQADQLMSRGVGEFGDNVDAASNNFASSLNGIINYQRQLAAINPLQAGSLNQMNPDFSGIVNTLNGILPTAPAAPQPGTGMEAGSSLVSAPTIDELLRRRKGLYQPSAWISQ